ncbi:MAG: single-stranded-DNA-specific exonuclease RecJ [Rhodospirillales bacterium]|nr:single-stranded-DNA-specific exonuclease RecJ [Rhodospirillales bacterium]
MTPSIIQRPPIPGSDGWNWPEGTHRVLRQVFSRRMIGSPGDLDLSLKHLRPVGEFLGLDAGVDALLRHRRGRVVIAGDFDADGATGAALLMLCLRDFGFEFVDVFIPDRFELGYGLTAAAVERIARRRPSLIVTVDNGISSIAGTAAARDRGIDVLITDHHLPGPELPAANAIVNPNLEGSAFGGKSLAGVGVAFYLMAALGKRLNAAGQVARYLDLVAIGTMADMVKLDQSNRILIDQGLARIRAGRCRPGVRALCQVAKVPHDTVTAGQLAYQIAPRLNAAGRLDDMRVGVRCLVSESDEEALALADTLNELNLERRAIGARMDSEALEHLNAEILVDSQAAPPVVCLFQENWHEGLVGLVASRIKERFHRPAFAFAPNDSGTLKGSGRSVRGFHLRDALVDVDAANPGLIGRFGGHAMAAGLTLHRDGFDDFRTAMEEFGAERLGPEHFAERIFTDGELRNGELSLEVATLLRDAGPWGQGFPEPLFEGTFRLIRQRVVGDAHLKMTVAAEGGASRLDAIAFNRQPGEWKPGDRLLLAYRLDVNEYYVTPSLQLIVEHVRPTGP